MYSQITKVIETRDMTYVVCTQPNPPTNLISVLHSK